MRLAFFRVVTKNANGYCNDDVAMFCRTFYYEFLYRIVSKIWLYPLLFDKFCKCVSVSVVCCINFKDEYTCYSRTIDFMRVVDWLFEKEQIQSHERKNYTITSSTRSISHFTPTARESKKVKWGAIKQQQFQRILQGYCKSKFCLSCGCHDILNCLCQYITR